MGKWLLIAACVIWILVSLVEPSWIIAITNAISSIAKSQIGPAH